MPSWIRSSSVSSEPWYFLAIETTSRRFALIMRSLAARSPLSIRFASSISSSGVSSRWRPISLRNSCSVSVVTWASAASSTGRGAGLAAAVVLELDPARVELLVEAPTSGSSKSSACASSSTSLSSRQPRSSPRSISAARAPLNASSVAIMCMTHRNSRR